MTKRLGVAILMGLAALACGDTIELAQNPPAVSIDALEADGAVVDIFYRTLDIEGDDVDIDIVVCRDGDCLTPTAVPGGDGTTHLPTVPGEPILHLFRWAPGCDLDGPAFDEVRVVRITPNDGRAGETAESEPFRLSELAVTPSCPDSP